MVTIMKKQTANTKKLRMTRQRKALLEVIQKGDSHPTADEVYHIVRKKLPHISLGTVYRNLDKLTEEGMLKKLEMGGSQRRYETKQDFHYHVRCLVCGKVDDVSIKFLSNLEKEAAIASDYTITGHHLEFNGLCKKCRKSSDYRDD